MNYRLLLVLFIATIGFAATQINSEGCDPYFPLEKGIKWEYQESDKNGEVSGYTTTIVEDVITKGSATEYVLKAVSDGPKKKEKNHFERTFSYVCDNGVLTINLDDLIPQETMEGMESMDIELTQKELIIPKTLNAGDNLNDGNVHMIASTSGVQVMEMNIDITDRKVEKIEDITTPSGTYKCALITYKTSTKMAFMNTSSTSKDWYSPEVGIVKSETFDKNGNLSSSRILTGYSK